MKNPIGRKRWAIAEGYIPKFSNGPEPEMTSHETACLLNTSDQDAHVQITIYFSDREAVGPYRVIVPANRTKHLRFNDLNDPAPIPRGTDYASVIESDVLLSCNIPDWTHGRVPMPCSRQSPTRRQTDPSRV